MGILVDALGGRVAGELIRATDWNALIAAVEALGADVAALSASVDARLAAVAARLDAQEARIGAAEQTAAALGAALDDVRGRFRRVTLQADRVAYALGEPAPIGARVAALGGEPLALDDPEARPWIDFVASWGRLRPAPGFEGQSLGGEADRTLSVRVDARGEARVLLRAEPTEGFALEAEDEVSAALTTRLLGGAERSIAATILQAATPLEASQRGAFRALSTEYDRTDAAGVRRFVDAAVLRDPIRIPDRSLPPSGHAWRDHRATVLVLVKPDNDPRTADPSLGAGSIQVTFRDWIGPWIALDYLAEVPALADRYRDRLGPKIDQDFRASAARLQDEVVAIVRDKGLVAQQRDYQAVGEALGRISVAQPPPFLNELTGSVRHAVLLQQAIAPAQASALAPGGPAVAFAAFAATAVRGEATASAVRDDLTGLIQQRLAQVRDQVRTQVRQEQQSFKADLLKEDGPIVSVQKALSDVAGRVVGVQEALGSKASISDVSRLLRP